MQEENSDINAQKTIDNCYSIICDTLVHAKTRSKNYLSLTKKPLKKAGIRLKDWRDESLQKLFDLMKIEYIKYRQSNYNEE